MEEGSTKDATDVDAKAVPLLALGTAADVPEFLRMEGSVSNLALSYDEVAGVCAELIGIWNSQGDAPGLPAQRGIPGYALSVFASRGIDVATARERDEALAKETVWAYNVLYWAHVYASDAEQTQPHCKKFSEQASAILCIPEGFLPIVEAVARCSTKPGTTHFLPHDGEDVPLLLRTARKVRKAPLLRDKVMAIIRDVMEKFKAPGQEKPIHQFCHEYLLSSFDATQALELAYNIIFACQELRSSEPADGLLNQFYDALTLVIKPAYLVLRTPSNDPARPPSPPTPPTQDDEDDAGEDSEDKNDEEEAQEAPSPPVIQTELVIKLYRAATKGDVEAATAVVSSLKHMMDSPLVKRNVNTRDVHTGMGALHIASSLGHVEIARLLLASGADVNATADNKWTPLFFACYHGHADVVRLLMDFKADQTCIDIDSLQPFHLACKQWPEVVKVLQEFGADVNMRAHAGWTPLIMATYADQPEIVNLLLQWNADFNCYTSSQKRAVDYARGEECKRLLKKRMAIEEAERIAAEQALKSAPSTPRRKRGHGARKVSRRPSAAYLAQNLQSRASSRNTGSMSPISGANSPVATGSFSEEAMDVGRRSPLNPQPTATLPLQPPLPPIEADSALELNTV